MQPDNKPIAPFGQEAAVSENAQQFITFTLGAEEYGIDIMVVREIKGWTETTMIPNAPPHVRGVINLRGIIVPIFDLRARFGTGVTVPTNMHVVIIVAAGTRTVGLLVDTVSDIISVDPKDIRDVPDMGMPTEDQFLEGLVAIQNRMVTLVSLSGLFGMPASSVTRTSAAAAAAAA
ncbi:MULTISPECIES: chemotaxis protein CheW [Bradyrhizobium]|jgi:purine-binding chemotaxis protein CheW|uniref:chemotaxis protein CheW n=1 Tax=Bradyrhizobium TaxID=374 RepID=UPI00005DCE54|nr:MULTISPECIES: chemotaxis protein CheW [Bradyrhizobium]ABQ34330.1 Chemotaxis protein cheW [Bradyrhizobium sp. BTAi1]MCL8482626.1 chemotaxis protein CheW [Bradyrhizobium denitrificans]RTM06030.1 MAG: purine-binding chemotaxis protein CheW [Bradyrhizobiaceae bacterium]